MDGIGDDEWMEEERSGRDGGSMWRGETEQNEWMKLRMVSG